MSALAGGFSWSPTKELTQSIPLQVQPHWALHILAVGLLWRWSCWGEAQLMADGKEQRLSLFCLSHWACWPNLSLATGHTKNREVGREHGILYEKEIRNLLLQVEYPFFGIIGTGNVLDFGLFWILEDLHKHYAILGMRSFIHVQYTPL